VTNHERLRVRCILDAIVSELYGLELDDLTWILKACDYPSTSFNEYDFLSNA
jgi:hypothetical protein